MNGITVLRVVVIARARSGMCTRKTKAQIEEKSLSESRP
jgi:hypothetical protein